MVARVKMGRISNNSNENDQKIKIIAQEIKFAKILAGNDKKLRDKTLKNLNKWLSFRSQSSIPLTDENFMRLWKGLFYCMWMSDKLLTQEECAERISNLIHSFTNEASSILFFKCFLQTMINEWFGVDQLRLNKFLMLVRRCLRQVLEVIRNSNWNKELINQFNGSLNDTVLKNSSVIPLGLTMHIIEIFLEELAKVSQGKLTNELTTEFLRPFVRKLSVMNDQADIDHVIEYIFIYLLKQSNVGIEYAEKFEAWRSRGFPGGSINCIERVPIENEDEFDEKNEVLDLEDSPKDPRAGQVDVILKQIPFSPKQIIKLLKECQFNKETNLKSRTAMNKIIKQFTQLDQGDYPLGIKTISIPSSFLNTQEAAENLLKFEEELYSESPNASKKISKRKLKLVNPEFDELLENEEQPEQKKRKKDTKLEDNELEKFIEKSEKNIFHNGLTANEFLLKKRNSKKEKCSSNIELNNKKVTKIKSCNQSNNIKKEKRIKILESKIEKLKKPIIIGIAHPSGIWEVTDNDCNTIKNSRSEINHNVSKLKQKINKCKKTNKDPLKENNQIQKLSLSLPKKEKPPSTKNTVTLKTSLKKTKASTKKEIFPQTEWDVPLKSNEIEILIPTKKVKKNIGKVSNNQMIEKSKNKNMLVKSPLVKIKKKSMANNLDKKVKIALQKNRAQDTIEYIKQVQSSPAIPFDATKKPSKPLLKPTNVKSPINPFYKLKDSFT